MFVSNFKPWSVGVAVVAKERESRELKVYPVEFVPGLTETPDDSHRERQRQGIDSAGNQYTVNIVEQAWIPCDWLGSVHRELPPDVQAGEQVLIYRSGDGDKYYWDIFGRNESHRVQEDVIISFAAKPEPDSGVPVAKDATNSYRFRVNTYEKYIELTTSAANEEVTTYSMKMDLANGTFELVDADTNRFYLDTPEALLEMYNKEESYVRIHQKDIFLNSQDNIQMDTTAFLINCDTFELNAETSVTINTAECTIAASDTIDMSTKTLNISGTNTTMEANNAALNFSNCTVGNGTWTVNAQVTFTKPVATTSSLTASGGLTSTGAGGKAKLEGGAEIGSSGLDVKGPSKFAPPLKTTDGATSSGS